MKRFAMVFVLALLALTSVFSATLDSAELNVTMELTEEKLSSYAVGFTDAPLTGNWAEDEIDMTNLPNEITEIGLTYDPVSSKAKNATNYIYYKARTTKSIVLKLGANGSLVDNSTKNSVDFSVKVDGVADAVTSGTGAKAWESERIAPEMGNSFVAGYFPIELETNVVNAGDVGNYSTSLTLVVEAIG